jgi:hypothetical protein
LNPPRKCFSGMGGVLFLWGLAPRKLVSHTRHLLIIFQPGTNATRFLWRATPMDYTAAATTASTTFKVADSPIGYKNDLIAYVNRQRFQT